MMQKQKIINTISDIIEILEKTDESEWLKSFKYFLTIIDKEENGVAFKNEVLKIYGGMGSFNDLVLYRDGILLKDENNKLNKLRKSLFILLK